MADIERVVTIEDILFSVDDDGAFRVDIIFQDIHTKEFLLECYHGDKDE